MLVIHKLVKTVVEKDDGVILHLSPSEAGVLAAILSKVSGPPEYTGSGHWGTGGAYPNGPQMRFPLPRGIMTGWFDGQEAQKGLLAQLEAAEVKPSKIKILGDLYLDGFHTDWRNYEGHAQ